LNRAKIKIYDVRITILDLRLRRERSVERLRKS